MPTFTRGRWSCPRSRRRRGRSTSPSPTSGRGRSWPRMRASRRCRCPLRATRSLRAHLQTIPEGATSRSPADPPSLPASGGTSRGRFEVDSPTPLPSGTVVQAVLTETFRLVSGEEATGEQRLEDILLFRADLDGVVAPRSGVVALAAEMPIVPSRQFEATELEEGRVHLSIMSGREGSRGMGGSDAITVSSGGATFTVPAGALPENTAIRFERLASVAPTVPQPPGMTAQSEMLVDLAGATLGLAAELSLPAAGTPSGGSFFVARFELVGGASRLQVVAFAQRVGDQIVTRGRAAAAGHPPGRPLRRLPPAAARGVPRRGRAGSSAAGARARHHLPRALRRHRGIGRRLHGPDPDLVGEGHGARARHLVRGHGRRQPGGRRRPGAGHHRQPDADDGDRDAGAGRHGRARHPTDRGAGERAARCRTTPRRRASSLRRTSDGSSVAVGTVLSADRPPLAVIPQAPLAYLTSYTFEVVGLKDVVRTARRGAGGDVHDRRSGEPSRAEPGGARLLLSP